MKKLGEAKVKEKGEKTQILGREKEKEGETKHGTRKEDPIKRRIEKGTNGMRKEYGL